MSTPAATNVEMTCLQMLADLERPEGPWVETIAGGDSEGAALIMGLLLAHMSATSKRVRAEIHPLTRNPLQ